MRHTPRKAIAKAVFETLEGRTCLSATIGLHDGVLLLRADPNVGTPMQVQFAGNHNIVSAFTSGQLKFFQASKIHLIEMIGSNANDSIYVDPRLGLPARIEGGLGNDTIKGGTGFDTIDGGAGNDLIYGHGIISTGAGDDTVWGSTGGGDLIMAGPGRDLLIGGNGNDTLVGGSGNSTLIGGAGNDELIAGRGNTIVRGGIGANTIIGGPGADTLYGGSGRDVIMVGSATAQVHAARHDTVEPTAPGTPAPIVVPPVIGTPVSAPPAPVLPPAPVPITTPPVPKTPRRVAGAPGPQSNTTTQAVIEPLETTVLTGEGVEVNGLDSVLQTGTRLTAAYQWNFGDPGSQYNNLTGWNAGHVYDNPGLYTITLTVTDAAGQSSTATSQVAVGSDNRPIIYVDTNGSDSHSGASPQQAVQTANRAFALATNGTKIEFRRGEVFNVNTTLDLYGQDIYVGAYGDGASPVLNRLQGNGDVIIFLSGKSRNITVQGLTFDSPNAVSSGPADKIGLFGVWAEGQNVVVRDNTFLNLDDAINGSIQPTGVIVQDNSAPLLTGLRGYFCWIDGTDWTIIGNTVANSTREHDIRSNSMITDRVLIEDNNLDNPTRPDDPGEIVKTTINIRAGHDIYITDNTLSDAAVAMGPGQFNAETDETSWVKIDANTINYSQIYLAGAVHHAMLSNNVVTYNGSTEIRLITDDPTYTSRHLMDVTITHNLGLDSATTGNFLEVSGVGLPGQITVTNNLYAAPRLQSGINTSGGIIVFTSDLNEFAQISQNVWPAPTGAVHSAPGAVNYVAGLAYPTGYLSPEEWDDQSNVQDDQFQDVTLPNGTHQLTLNGTTAGPQYLAAA